MPLLSGEAGLQITNGVVGVKTVDRINLRLSVCWSVLYSPLCIYHYLYGCHRTCHRVDSSVDICCLTFLEARDAKSRCIGQIDSFLGL